MCTSIFFVTQYCAYYHLFIKQTNLIATVNFQVNIILQCHALLHYLTFLDNIDHHLITGTDNQVNHKVIIHCE